MKTDKNFISRLEVGDRFQNTRGEMCQVTNIDKFGNIRAGTVETGRESYLRIYDKNGNGSPSSEQIKTP